MIYHFGYKFYDFMDNINLLIDNDDDGDDAMEIRVFARGHFHRKEGLSTIHQ